MSAQSQARLAQQIKAVDDSPTDRLDHLAAAAGLDKTRDLRGFDFRGADLTGARFRNARILGANFDGSTYDLRALREAADFDEFLKQDMRRPAQSPRHLSDRRLKDLAAFRDAPYAPEMIVIPSGRFVMGSPKSEEGRHEDEGPQHEATIVRRFAVGRFAVTFDEWDACVANGGCNGYRPEDRGWGRGRHPVINVSWDDARAYVSWLSRKTGQTYRLLSEAEWEYAARAGTTTPFWWGASISPEQANYDGNYTYGKGAKGKYRHLTMPVDSFEPNPWGLYQVHGNVWEWVEDGWHDDYDGAPRDGSAWTTGASTFRVLRGGSWRDHPRVLRAAVRYWITPDYRNDYFGFRVGRTLIP